MGPRAGPGDVIALATRVPSVPSARLYGVLHNSARGEGLAYFPAQGGDVMLGLWVPGRHNVSLCGLALMWTPSLGLMEGQEGVGGGGSASQRASESLTRGNGCS